MMSETQPEPSKEVQQPLQIEFKDVTVRYADKVALDNISFQVPDKSIIGIIGPANSGKTTLLKCINRTIDFIDSAKVEGVVEVRGEDVNRMRNVYGCLLYTSPSPRDATLSRMPSSA